MINKRKLKPFVIPMLYSIAFIALVVSLFFLRETLNTPVFDDEDNDYEYVSKTIFDDEKPVVSNDKSIIRPYKDSEIRALKYFYDKDAEMDKQKESIIFYKNTYMPNSGVDYGGKENFEVVSILDGTVIEVKEEELLGKTIEIRHSNEIISVYQCLSEMTVKKDDVVKQGDIIGKSGTCDIASDLKDHLHLEIMFSGTVIDPEKVYDKTIKDL